MSIDVIDIVLISDLWLDDDQRLAVTVKTNMESTWELLPFFFVEVAHGYDLVTNFIRWVITHKCNAHHHRGSGHTMPSGFREVNEPECMEYKSLSVPFVRTTGIDDCLKCAVLQAHYCLWSSAPFSGTRGSLTKTVGMRITTNVEISNNHLRLQPIKPGKNSCAVYICEAVAKGGTKHAFTVYVTFNKKVYYADSSLHGFLAYDATAVSWIKSWCTILRVVKQ